MINAKKADLLNKIAELEASIEAKNRIIENNENIILQLQGMINKKNRMIFGSKSEKVDLNQLSLFNEVEDEIKKSKEPKRKRENDKKLKKLHEQVIEKVSEVKEYKIDSNECDQCNSELRAFSNDKSYTIEYIPAEVKVIEHKVYNYVCDTCNKEKKLPVLLKAKGPKKILDKSVLSSSLAANLITEKYNHHMPLYRIENKYSQEIGFDISRMTMSNWIFDISNIYLTKIHDRLVELIKHCEIIHGDETTVPVVQTSKKNGKAHKSYMWVYVSGKFENNQIAIYDYHNNRRHENAKHFLKGYKNVIIADGYDAYKAVPNITLVGCFQHVRSKFFDALNVIPVDKRTETREATGIMYCNSLFDLEKKELSDSEKINSRIKILNEFKEWLDKVSLAVIPKSVLGKAIAYALNQWAYLSNIALDAKIEPSNNRAERAIRPFTIGRSAWKFYFSENGARTSSKIYSIVETCRLNMLNVSKYFEYILNTMASEEFEDKNIDSLLPISDTLPSDLYINS